MHARYLLVFVLPMLLGACSKSNDEVPVATTESLELVGTSWQIVDIDGGGVVDKSGVTLLFPEDGKVAGNSGCNRYFGSVDISGDTVSFGDAGATMMACPEPLMQQEQAFFAALNSVVRGELSDDAHLILYDAAGELRIRAVEYAAAEAVTASEQAEPLDKASEERFSFDCGQAGTADVRFLGPDTVELTFAGKSYALPNERTASGARYAKEGVSFWNKGDEALIEIGEARYTCARI